MSSCYLLELVHFVQKTNYLGIAFYTPLHWLTHLVSGINNVMNLLGMKKKLVKKKDYK